MPSPHARLNLTIDHEIKAALDAIARGTGQSASGLVRDMLYAQRPAIMQLAAALRLVKEAEKPFGKALTVKLGKLDVAAEAAGFDVQLALDDLLQEVKAERQERKARGTGAQARPGRKAEGAPARPGRGA